MRRQSVLGLDISQYFVKAESGEVREIKADSAYEAFRMSGFAAAQKIERIFLLNKNVVVKSTFAEEMPQEASVPDAPSLHERLVMRKSPVISADELEEIMRASRVTPINPESLAIIEATVAVEPPVAMMPPPAVEVGLPPVPDADSVRLPADMTNPVGTDVHGDGFDEIIPSAQMPVKPPAPLKFAEPKAEQKAEQKADAPVATPDANGLPPERELSAEEVEKLLGGQS
jgi:hypothetical protein